jgi:hypothetical protein
VKPVVIRVGTHSKASILDSTTIRQVLLIDIFKFAITETICSKKSDRDYFPKRIMQCIQQIYGDSLETCLKAFNLDENTVRWPLWNDIIRFVLAQSVSKNSKIPLFPRGRKQDFVLLKYHERRRNTANYQEVHKSAFSPLSVWGVGGYVRLIVWVQMWSWADSE